MVRGSDIMAINFQLEEPHREMCSVVFEPPWTWEEFDAKIDAITAAILAAPSHVALLMDMTYIGQMPEGNVLAHLQRMVSLMPHNVDIAVLLNVPYAVVNFVSILMHIRPRVKDMTFFAHSLNEGHAIIHERRKYNASARRFTRLAG